MDYSDMKAQQVSKKKIKPETKVSKSTKNKVKRAMKKTPISWIIVGLVLIFGVVGGFFAHKYAFQNDVYQMVTYADGQSDIYIGGDENTQIYTELGVKCIAFGKDYSKDCTVKYYYRADLTQTQTEVAKVDENIPGMYYAVYSTPAGKYKSVTLIRNIIVMREEG